MLDPTVYRPAWSLVSRPAILENASQFKKTLSSSAGYPIVSHFITPKPSTLGGFNLGGINASGQVPLMAGNWGLIDSETPQDAYTRPSYNDPSVEMQLVFSDEFNIDGRSFYPGDDPYWEAVDLHYWQVKLTFFSFFSFFHRYRYRA